MKQVYAPLLSITLTTFLAFVLSGTLLLLRVPVESGDVFCVVSAGSTLDSYPRCTRVFTTIQSAVDTASGGEEILVAGGIYTDIHQRKGVTQVVYIDKNIAIRGGYDGTFGSFSPEHLTILDAQGKGRVIYVTGNVSVTLEGLGITGGDATALGGEGGGIYLRQVTATLRHNRIYSNTALVYHLKGGGVNRTLGRATNSHFVPSFADAQSLTAYLQKKQSSLQLALAQRKQRSSSPVTIGGGGIYAAQSNLILVDNEITGNYASDSGNQQDNAFGGGIYATESNLRLERNIVRGNTGCRQGNYCEGGGLSLGGSSIFLLENEIEGNMAGFYGKHSSGGGVFLTGEHIFLEDNLVVQNVTSQSNLEGSYSSLIIGGGIVALGGDVTAINNQIVSNTAVITSMSPSGIVLGGGIVVNGTEVQLIHNTIRGNVGVESGYYLSQGGGMYLEDIGHLVLADNLVEGNIAAFAGQSGDGGGGVIARYNAPESVVVADRNIIQNNVGSFSRGGIGGGVLVGNFRPNIPPLEITFRDNQILSNTATVSGTFGAGGGMVIAEGHVWMSGNLFRNNSVRLCGGGVFFSKSEGVLENTVFIQNRAALGGAALAVDDHSDIRMLHSTFTENDGGDESGILMSHWDDAFSTLAMTNTIFATHTTGISITAHNTVTLHSVLWYNTPVPMIAQSATTVIADHQHWGDPRFAVDGYHLKPASAAIGQGIDTPVIYDIDGQPRRFPPDLGADEYWRMSFYLPMVIRYR